MLIPDKITGDIYTAAEFTSFKNESQNAIEGTDQTLSASSDVQLAKALTIAGQTAHSYQDSGAADAYVLTRTGLLEQPLSYVDGSRITFITANANTGASTVNVSGLGVKKILLQDGTTTLSGGEIRANEFVDLVYNSAADSAAGAYTTIKQNASETVAGVAELATSAEAITGTDAVRAITPSTLRSGLNASGSAPVYACRAWVNFNGTGTVAIRASGNVSSITDVNVGEYKVNFITSMPDADYSACAQAGGSANVYRARTLEDTISRTIDLVAVKLLNTADAAADAAVVSVHIFR